MRAAIARAHASSQDPGDDWASQLSDGWPGERACLVPTSTGTTGCGSVGIAWEIGVAARLAKGGVDVRDADFITRTSVGPAVGAQLALGRDLEELVRLCAARMAGFLGAGPWSPRRHSRRRVVRLQKSS
jgi:hypothetical protein